MTAASSPVQPDERYPALDILRAFALLGIFVMNLWGMAESWYHEAPAVERWPAWCDAAALCARTTFFDGKFNSLYGRWPRTRGPAADGPLIC